MWWIMWEPTGSGESRRGRGSPGVALWRELSPSAERLQIHGDQEINTGLSAQSSQMSPVAFCLRRTPNTEVESAFLSAPLHYRLWKKSFSRNFHILCRWTCCPFTRAFVFQFAASYLSTLSLSLSLHLSLHFAAFFLSISAYYPLLFFFSPLLWLRDICMCLSLIRLNLLSSAFFNSPEHPLPQDDILRRKALELLAWF